MNPKRGEVWLADLGMAAKLCPVVILSRDDPDPPRVLFIYAPLSTQHRGSGYEAPVGRLPFLAEESIVNVQGISSLPRVRFESRLGRLPDAHLELVNKALLFALARDAS